MTVTKLMLTNDSEKSIQFDWEKAYIDLSETQYY